MDFMFGRADDRITVLEIMGKDPNEKRRNNLFLVFCKLMEI